MVPDQIPICRRQLRRIRSFLKLQTARIYQDRKGRTRVAGYLDKVSHIKKQCGIDIYVYVVFFLGDLFKCVWPLQRFKKGHLKNDYKHVQVSNWVF